MNARPDTAIADAMRRAGYQSKSKRLALAAFRALTAAGRDPDRALFAFRVVLSQDDELQDLIALQYLHARAADMRGDSLAGKGRPTSTRKGHPVSALPSQDDEDGPRLKHFVSMPGDWLPKPSLSNADRAGQQSVARRAGMEMPARSAPSQNSVEDDEGHTNLALKDSHVLPSPSSPQADREGPIRPAATAGITLPSRSAPALTSSSPYRPTLRGFDVIARRQPVLQRSLMETYRLSDGALVGSLRWHELLKRAKAKEIDARVLRYLSGHVANADSLAFVRDVVSDAVLAQAVAYAEQGDAA